MLLDACQFATIAHKLSLMHLKRQAGRKRLHSMLIRYHHIVTLIISKMAMLRLAMDII
nr:MAG TPA: hypothetical protein [Caudoviricetes sp.]